MTVSVVIPTVGRASLATLLRSLGACDGPRPARVIVVDDRPRPDGPLRVASPGWLDGRVTLRRSGGRGPAAARNTGWRAAVGAEWVVFLDDDVQVTPSWLTDLQRDLQQAEPDVAGVQGILAVPAPAGRRPTDAERQTMGLAGARWITADMAYRRAILSEVGGFDERFTRAFREDSELALRVLDAGCRLTTGSRRTLHPVRPQSWWISVARQRGNADDALMRRLHGRDWRRRAGATIGRRPMHVLVTTMAVATCTASAARRRRLATVLAAGWTSATAQFAWARIAPGPRTAREVAAMTVTSAAIPPAAVAHWLHGTLRYRRAPSWAAVRRYRVAAVLLDRDGTLVRDVPYNGDPDRVEPMPGAAAALDRLRAAGVALGVVSNQSAIGRGALTREQVDAVNERVERLLGPFDVWRICPHAPGEGCDCRKPRPGLVREAAAELGVTPQQCVLIGDIGADVDAAHGAGASPVLVPTTATEQGEIDSAPTVYATLPDAVDAVLPGVRP